MTYRHSQVGSQKARSPEALAARLPDELKSFDAWYYSSGDGAHGLEDYLAAVAAHIEHHEPVPVMAAAGLSAADWYRHMLT
jgi:hypothetical protein